MQTHSMTQYEQVYAADRNDAEAMPRELSDMELETVAGGKVQMQDFHFVAKMDKASPKLF